MRVSGGLAAGSRFLGYWSATFSNFSQLSHHLLPHTLRPTISGLASNGILERWVAFLGQERNMTFSSALGQRR